jgi:hypothetical protein
MEKKRLVVRKRPTPNPPTPAKHRPTTSFRDVEDIRLQLNSRYPDVNDPPETEDPMIAVGIVLISAIILGTTDISGLVKFTGYSENFISAIASNMTQNKLWVNGGYDESQFSKWFSFDGVISNDLAFWRHIEMACGIVRIPGFETVSFDPCEIYRDEREHPNWRPN